MHGKSWRRQRRRLTILAALVIATASSVTFAQVDGPSDGLPPDVPQAFLNRYRQIGGDTLRLCVYPEGMTGELDAAVARAIGEVLLIDVELVEIDSAIDIPGLDIIPISEDELFIYLSNDCEAFLGFALATGVYDSWLTVTRPYVEARFVAVTTSSDIGSLGQVAAGGIVGTVMLSEADVSVGTFDRSRPEDQRWRRFPYPHTPLLMERLVDGTVEVAVGWEPAVKVAAELLNAEVTEIDDRPLDLPTRAVGMVLRSDEAFVRDALDSAIAALAERGVLDEILVEVGFPGSTP